MSQFHRSGNCINNNDTKEYQIALANRKRRKEVIHQKKLDEEKKLDMEKTIKNLISRVEKLEKIIGEYIQK